MLEETAGTFSEQPHCDASGCLQELPLQMTTHASGMPKIDTSLCQDPAECSFLISRFWPAVVGLTSLERLAQFIGGE